MRNALAIELGSIVLAVGTPAFAASKQLICKTDDAALSGFYYKLELEDQKRAATVVSIPSGIYAKAWGSGESVPTRVVSYSLDSIHLKRSAPPTKSSDVGIPLSYKRLKTRTNYVLDRLAGTLIVYRTVEDEHDSVLSSEQINAVLKTDMETLYSTPESALEHGRDSEEKMMALWLVFYGNAPSVAPTLYNCSAVTKKI